MRRGFLALLGTALVSGGSVAISPAPQTPDQYRLQIGYQLPSDPPELLRGARRAVSRCLPERVLCTSTPDEKRRGDCELAFRICISSIEGAKFWLAVCPKDDCKESEPLFPLSAEEATDPRLNAKLNQVPQPGWYTSTGIYVALSGDSCMFRKVSDDSKAAFPSEQAFCQALKNHQAHPCSPLLTTAIEKSQMQLVDFLLSRGIDVNQCKGLDCPLRAAVSTEKWDIVERLVREHGADVNKMNNISRYILTPLAGAARKNDMAMVRLLVESGAKINVSCSPLNLAVRNRNREMVEFLLANGGDIGRCDVVASAVYQNDAEMVKFLVKQGAPIDKPSHLRHDYPTPLSIAAEHGNLDMAKLLLQLGAKIEGRRRPRLIPYSHSPVYYAAQKGHVEMVKFLLGRGAKVDGPEVGMMVDDTPLHVACHFGHTAVVRLLLQHGANVNQKSHWTNDTTPLHQAVGRDHLEIVKLLVEHGADLSVLDGSGDTPLAFAEKLGQQDVVAFLRSRGAR